MNTQRAEIEIKRLVLDTPVTLTREYLIPEYACGRIIGRGGASVREISQLSSCKVLIDKRFDSSALIRDKSLMNIAGIPMNSAEFANTSHKVVTLCGSIEQIESAKVRFYSSSFIFISTFFQQNQFLNQHFFK